MVVNLPGIAEKWACFFCFSPDFDARLSLKFHRFVFSCMLFFHVHAESFT